MCMQKTLTTVALVVVLLMQVSCADDKRVCHLTSGDLIISSWHGNNFGVVAELHGRYRIENGNLKVDGDDLNLRQVINGYYGYVTVKQVRLVVLGRGDEQHFTTYSVSEPLIIDKTFDERRLMTVGSFEFTTNIDVAAPLDEMWLGLEIENSDGGSYYAHTPRNFFVREYARAGCIDSPCEGVDTVELAIETRCDAALTEILEGWSYPIRAWIDEMYERDAPVWTALVENNVTALRILHDHDVEIDVTGKTGGTPLMMAAANGSVDMVSTLLKLGADPNFVIQNGNEAGRTALNGALAAHSPDTVLQLLKHGGRTDLPDAYGWLPVHYAVYYDSLPSLEILVQEGNSLDTPASGRRGETPLMVAAQYSKIEAIKFLLVRGASKQRTDRYGKTALDYANYFNKPEAAALLLPAAE